MVVCVFDKKKQAGGGNFHVAKISPVIWGIKGGFP
jgi:hypothetical protein